MGKLQSTISDKIALSNMETLLRIPIIKRNGLLGIDTIMSKRPVKFKPSKGFKFNQTIYGGVRVDIVEREELKEEKAIIYFHSGGFVSGTTDTHRSIAELFLKNSNASVVFVVNYSTAPEKVFPCAHEDSFNAYKAIKQDIKYKNYKFISAGDSSGGNLALALPLMAKDKGFEVPDGILLISPWIDLTHSGSSYLDNYNTDPMFGYLSTAKDRLLLELYSKNADLKHRYLSPVFTEFNGLSKMLIQASKKEMLLSDSLMAKENADKASVECELLLYNNMFHSFQTLSPNAATSKLAWVDSGNFINNI